jgi:hypothetical protein
MDRKGPQGWCAFFFRVGKEHVWSLSLLICNENQRLSFSLVFDVFEYLFIQQHHLMLLQRHFFICPLSFLITIIHHNFAAFC